MPVWEADPKVIVELAVSGVTANDPPLPITKTSVDESCNCSMLPLAPVLLIKTLDTVEVSV